MIVDDKYLAFPYKIEIDRCVESCNNIINPHSKVFVPDIVKNVTVKMFDLMNLENTIKQVEFHEICKCVCKIKSSACSEKQRFNKNKCRCECWINKKCQNDFVWNYREFPRNVMDDVIFFCRHVGRIFENQNNQPATSHRSKSAR